MFAGSGGKYHFTELAERVEYGKYVHLNEILLMYIKIIDTITIDRNTINVHLMYTILSMYY